MCGASVRLAAVLLLSVPLAGCPSSSMPPKLSINSSVLNFGTIGVEESIAISNSGGGILEWTVSEDIPWLEPTILSGSTTNKIDRVKLMVDRTGLGPGSYTGKVTIDSNGGSKVVSVAMKVPGTPQLQASPTSINLVGTQQTATLTLSNSGDDLLGWSVKLYDASAPGVPITLPAYLSISPTTGSVAAGGQAQVTITVDRELFGEGLKSFILVINSTGGTQEISLNITSSLSGQLAVEPKVLDFGTDLNQLTFDVYNAGATGSKINFSITTDRADLISFSPSSGSSTGTAADIKDIVTIGVTIDRDALKGDSDGGKLFVNAPGMDPIEVLVTAEVAPITFEGPMNRTRPPFIMRFIFILRDSQGRAIDSNDPTILAELQDAFTVYEDGTPIDSDETNLFVTNGLNLKYNLMLMLDYTGSMFHAGDGHGTAIAQMVTSARAFIQAMPPSYRLGLMEYHERQQQNRLIHGFSTDRESLLDSLDAFTVPANEHGASEVYDAVYDACTRLENEDAGVLAFDDADVRGLVFISDGRDTSSIKTLDETIQYAKDLRVRLYPIGFGRSINSLTLVRMATETGGHYYAAPTVAELAHVLEREIGAPANAPGVVLRDLSRQVVLNYITLFQEGSHAYALKAEYNGQQGYVERDGVYAIGGDVRAGQLALTTSGIESNGTAEVYLRTDYVPRNVTQFRVRFITNLPYQLEVAEGGLLDGWTVVNEGGGVYTVLTTEDNPIRYGAFGNLLKLTFNNVLVNEFELGFRADNRIYVNPPFTKFFQYPYFVPVSRDYSFTASVAPILLEQGFDPDAPGAFDADGDATADFDDMFPDDKNHS